MTLTFAIGALLVAVAVALSAYFFTYHFLVHQSSRSAQRQTFLNAAIVRDRLAVPGSNVKAVIDALATGSASQSIVYRAGWSSSSLLVTQDSIPKPMRSTVLHGAPAELWTRINGAPQLVVGVPLPAIPAAYFEVFDQSALSQELTTLRTVLIAAASATTVAGAGLGLWASRRLTYPLRAITAASARIGAGNLETRLTAESDPDLAGLVASFNGMVDSLRQRIERDTRFAADVSHELRSPLTTLSTAVSVLETRRAELSERGRNALDLLSGEVRRFEHLVDDLLEISRLDAGAARFEAEPVQLSALVLNLLDREEYAGVDLRIDSASLYAVVSGDKRRLEQALRNLLDNARMHGGGVTAVAVEPSPAGIAVVVDDEGPGVAPQERERIFERFARGSGGRRRGSGGGSGLGLALVREHAEVHGGTVRAEARPGGGARFVLELPVVPE
ncbi:MAG TPA: HAMP domain-containing sensor histidine kinase [Mycobacteriales bacterium]|nr:HAMP domain-containing sensor histidine kinase [Mycobacteriales bacterium]